MALTQQQKLGLGLGLGLGIPFFVIFILPLIVFGIAAAVGVSLFDSAANAAAKSIPNVVAGAVAPRVKQLGTKAEESARKRKVMELRRLGEEAARGANWRHYNNETAPQSGCPPTYPPKSVCPGTSLCMTYDECKAHLYNKRHDPRGPAY